MIVVVPSASLRTKLKLVCILLLAAVSACGVSSPTLADAIYDWSYNGTYTISGVMHPDIASGTLTTGAADGGGFLITGITGSYNGVSITGLAPVGTCCSPFPPFNDNILFPTSTALLSSGGLGFMTAGYNVELYYDPTLNPGPYGALRSIAPDLAFSSGAFKITGPFPRVPGPVVGGGLPGLVLVGGLLAWWRHRSRIAA
jgi:hypothetical protein